MTRKPFHRSILAAALTGVLCTGAFAQTATDNAADSARDARAGRVDAGEMKDKHDKLMHEGKGHAMLLHDAFGISVRPLAREQAASHDLKPGVGLVVEEVTASSLAANGGVQKGDIIFQVGDQWAINPAQLATLLSIQEADDNFELKVYRGTDRVDLDFEFDQAALDTMNRSFDTAMASPDQRTDREMGRSGDMNRDKQMGGMDRNPMIIPETFDYKDDSHDIEIRTEDGMKKLTVKDDDGNVLFEGPYNTAQERDALPPEVKAKVERVLREKVK